MFLRAYWETSKCDHLCRFQSSYPSCHLPHSDWSDPLWNGFEWISLPSRHFWMLWKNWSKVTSVDRWCGWSLLTRRAVGETSSQLSFSRESIPKLPKASVLWSCKRSAIPAVPHLEDDDDYKILMNSQHYYSTLPLDRLGLCDFGSSAEDPSIQIRENSSLA